MIAVECPWCVQPAHVEASSLADFGCEGCGIAVEIAPDRTQAREDKAA